MPEPTSPGPGAIAEGLTIVRLEQLMARHWQAPDRDWLGNWLLRASGGFTGRGNSALAVSEPDRPLPEAVAAVTTWYAARGLPPLAAIPEPVPGAGPAGEPCDDPAAAARDAFAAAGFQVRAGAGALVLTAPTAALVPDPESGPAVELGPGDGLRLAAAERPDPDWLSTYRYRGQVLPQVATTLLMSAQRQVFLSIRESSQESSNGSIRESSQESSNGSIRDDTGGRTIAVARGSLDGDWVGVTAVEVAASHRRRGLARLLLAEIARWGLQHGGTGTYLQVGDANVAAIRLYEAAGFTVHHRYDYYELPG